MAVTLIGLRSAGKTKGSSPSGRRVYLMHSDAQVTTDIDPVIDSTDLPAYDAGWDGSTNATLKVTDKQAVTHDEYEGHYWLVNVTYATPTGNSDQDPLDPRDRPWDWSKSTDKYEINAVKSLFDTAGYEYPDTTAEDMQNLGAGIAITNTAFDPPEGGVPQMISRGVFNMTKYVDRDGYADILTDATSWADIDVYIDSVNSDTKSMLGASYTKWQMRMDDFNYEPYSENGFDVMRVSFSITVDTYREHVFSFPSAGYNFMNDDDVQQEIVTTGSKQPVTSPRLLDKSGLVIAPPVTAPFVAEPIIVSAGINEAKAWTNLQIPATIP